MSSPSLGYPVPFAEKPDYTLSASSVDSGSITGKDIYDQAPAFRNLPQLEPIEAEIAGEKEKRPDGIVERDGNVYRVIPEWTAPKAELGSLRRPALLPGQADASTYAKRFGVDNNAPLETPGRSMLTPIPDIYGDGTQMPDWVEDWQSFTFSGYTAEELKAQGAFDPDMELQYADSTGDVLQGDLHPLLDRDKWGQPSLQGDKGFPILVYNSDSQSGGPSRLERYDLSPKVKNDRLWEAMQPALRLASKVLESEPPFWKALFDLYNRRPVDDRLVPKVLEDDTSLTSIWLEVDEDKMYPEARMLRNTGFDAAGTTKYVLEKLIRLGFESFAPKKEGWSGGTSIVREAFAEREYTINLRIAPQMVWPLLRPEISPAEKTSVSMHIATTLLHELSHAVIFAHTLMMTVPDWNKDPALEDDTLETDLTKLSGDQIELLSILGQGINGSGGYNAPPRYFFQDESQAEEGYAFENTLWGGDLTYLTSENEMDKDYGFPSTINVSLKSWPHAKMFRSPRETEAPEGWPEWITEPPPTILSRETALPVAMYDRFFHEGFWGRGGPFSRYGQQALKLSTHQWEGKDLKSQMDFLYIRSGDVSRAFKSHRAYSWMLNGSAALREARQFAVADYLCDLTNSVVETSMMRKRLHHEKKTWARADAKIFGHIERITRLQSGVSNTLNSYKKAKSGGNGPSDPTARKALGTYIEQGCLIMTEASEVQRLLGVEVQYLQYLILGVVRQGDEPRKELRKYLDIILYRIQSVLKGMTNQVGQVTSNVYQQYLSEMAPDLPQQLNSNLHRLTNRFGTLATDIRTTLPSTRQNLSNLVEIIGACVVESAGGDLAPPPLERFNLLVDGSGINSMRTKRRQFRQLALRDLRSLPREGLETKIVKPWLRALQEQPKLDVAAERATASENIKEWLEKLDIGT